MPAPTHPIIALVSSAGGWDALPVVLENLPASVSVVQHLPSDSMGNSFLSHLARRLLEEHKRMLQKFAGGQPSPGQEQRLAENQVYIDRLRALLLDGKG